MLGVLAGPEAEAVVVLGREDHPRDAGRLGGAHPLAGIKFRRIELLRILRSVAPFPVGERVHAEVDEGGDFVALPGDLPRGRPNVRTPWQLRYPMSPG